MLQIKRVHKREEIDQMGGKDVMVRSFVDVYKDMPLQDIHPDFTSLKDMQRFYEEYFQSELNHFDRYIWIQAFDKDKLVGFVTYEVEEGNKAYMNTLVVAPEEQGKGIGKRLVFSIRECTPHITEIRLLLRKLNVKGRRFYDRLGFTDFPYTREDNFVDTALLTGLRWMAH